MSRLFESFMTELFGNNAHLYAEAQRLDAESKEEQWYDARKKCNPIENTIEEWHILDKPNQKQQQLKNN